jgi:carboxyl-terminal processing protease
MRLRWLFGFAVAAGAVGAGAWLLVRKQPGRPAATPIVGTRLFETVLSHVRTYSVDSLEDDDLYRRAAAGIVDELDDPYAELVLPGRHDPLTEDSPAPGGLFLDRRDGLIVVVSTVSGSPADSAGVRSGDRLVGVDTALVDASRLDLAIRLLGGRPGSSVALRVRRRGVRGPIALAMVRGPVTWPEAVAAEPEGGVVRIRVRRFVPGLADSLRRRLDAIRGAEVRGIALDLRGVVGGDLRDGVALADLFLDRGQRLATSRGRHPGASFALRDSTASPYDSIPLAVLVNGGTAGAAEAAAGALQDHDRAGVLGAATFGRGVTSSSFPLGGGASLRLTTALWITPSGRQIQRPPPRADGDSVPRPRFKTDGGRMVLGGGGIIPDRVIADTGGVDQVLAEARSLLIRAGTARRVLALVGAR